MNTPIHRQLRAHREDHDLTQRDIATHLDVHFHSVAHWDRGEQSPSVHHTIRYAHLVNQQPVITHNGTVICTLEEALPKLSHLRQARGLTQHAVSSRMRMAELAARAIERRCAHGTRLRLSTLLPYLAALGYQVGLVPAAALERAA